MRFKINTYVMPIEKFLIDWCLCRRSWCSYVDTLYKFTRRQLRLSPRFDCDWHICFRAGAFYLTATIGLGWIWWNRKKKINDLKKKTTRIERRRWQNNFAPHDTTSKFLNSLTVLFWILKGCVLYSIRRPREEREQIVASRSTALTLWILKGEKKRQINRVS